jgi:hypothetical protein
LEAVQFLRDGERIGGGVNLVMFDDGKVAGTAPAKEEDPLAGW